MRRSAPLFVALRWGAALVVAASAAALSHRVDACPLSRDECGVSCGTSLSSTVISSIGCAGASAGSARCNSAGWRIHTPVDQRGGRSCKGSSR